jgi:hypothetical protein
VVVLRDEDGARDVLHRIPHYTQRSRGLPSRTSSCSPVQLSFLTCHAHDAPIQGRLDGSLHTDRDSPKTSKVIPLYHDIRGIQLAMGILQWMTMAYDGKDDRGSDIPIGMIEGMLSARIMASP